MASFLKKHKHFLQYVATCGKKQRLNCIKNADKSEVKTLCECALNVYKGNVKIPTMTVKKLQPYKNVLRAIASKKFKKSKSKQIKLITQKGGAFLPLILTAVLPSLIKAAVDTFQNKTTNNSE
jgi:hypothetical protein